MGHFIIRKSDKEGFRSNQKLKIKKSINRSSIFYSWFSIRSIFLSLIDFDQKIFKSWQRYPRMLVHKLTRYTGMSVMSLHRVLQKTNLYLYRIAICQQLSPNESSLGVLKPAPNPPYIFSCRFMSRIKSSNITLG